MGSARFWEDARDKIRFCRNFSPAKISVFCEHSFVVGLTSPKVRAFPRKLLCLSGERHELTEKWALITNDWSQKSSPKRKLINVYGVHIVKKRYTNKVFVNTRLLWVLTSVEFCTFPRKLLCVCLSGERYKTLPEVTPAQDERVIQVTEPLFCALKPF